MDSTHQRDSKMSFASSKGEGEDSLDGGDSTSLLGESKSHYDHDVGSFDQFISKEDVEQIFSKV